MNPTETKTGPTIAIDEAAVVVRLADLWDLADRPTTWPCYDSDVLALVAAAGYLLSAKELEHWIDVGIIPEPGIQGGVRRWRPAVVWCLIGRLENLRRWNPTAAIHGAKLAAAELEYHVAKRNGLDPFTDLDEHPLELLLAYLAQTNDFNQRVALWLCVREKLERTGVL
jgi:hypothetical protein